MILKIFAAEISHESASLGVRETIEVCDSKILEYLLKLSNSVQEVFILSTCNRFAIYSLSDTITLLEDFFKQYKEVSSHVKFYYSTEESVKHLFETASGLCSQVIGEHQILSQIKQAHQFALASQSIGPVLDALLRNSIRVGKKVRSQTDIDKFCTSIVGSGFDLMYNLIGDFKDKIFLVVGTGKITRLTLEYLKYKGVKKLYIASDEKGRVNELAQKYNAEPIGIDKISIFFVVSDVIIGSTNHLLSICPSNMDPLKRYLVLDFGMPRNFNDSLRMFSCIKLYNLDDIKHFQSGINKSTNDYENAKYVVLEETQFFLDILKELELSPVLRAYWTRLVNIKDREFDWLFPKLNNVSQHDINLIKKFAHKIIRGISQEPFRNMRDWAIDDDRNNRIEIVKRLYNFTNESVDNSLK